MSCAAKGSASPRLASHRVPHGALGVAAAGRGGPPVPAGPGLGDGPPPGLLDLVAFPAARSAVAGAGLPALVVGGGVFEVAVPGVPGAGGEGALAVADLDQVPQRVAGLVAARLVPVVAAGDRDRSELGGEFPAAGQGEYPGSVPVWRAGAVPRGERPGAVAVSGRRGFAPGPGGFCAAVPDGDSGWVCHGDAPVAVRAARGGGREVAGQGGVERAQAVAGAGPVGEAEQGGQRDGQVDAGCQRRGRPAGRVTQPAAVRAAVARTAGAGSGAAGTALAACLIVTRFAGRAV